MEILLTPFAYLMQLFDSWTGNYALTLLLFTLFIKIVFIPFGIKQQKNQIRMAAIRPKEEAIRKKYAGRTDRATQEKMRQELLDLQQKENASPMSGCLPLILQMIAIMILYGIMRQPLTYICNLSTDAILAIGQEVGLTVKDAALTAENISGLDQINAISVIRNFMHANPEALSDYAAELAKMPNLSLFGLNLGVTPSHVWNGFIKGADVATIGIPNFGHVAAYAIIPILSAVLQFITMKLTRRFTYQSPSTQDAQTGCSMAAMDYTMPLFSLFICFTFTNAIGVYWIYSTVLSFVQTVILAKAMPIPKITDEQIRAAEKELKVKESADRKAAGNLPRVRSLHHIDDDDYDELPEAKKNVKSAPGSEKIAPAPLKDDNDKKN